ncbi:hypothetical protein YC2023_070887 [Brassica napus]
MSRDYVRGRGLRDVWASDATLIVRAGVQRRLDLRCYLCGRVVQRRLYHGRYLRGRGSVRTVDFRVNLLAIDDLHGSLLVNADVNFAINF